MSLKYVYNLNCVYKQRADNGNCNNIFIAISIRRNKNEWISLVLRSMLFKI